MQSIFADMNRIKEAINSKVAEQMPGYTANEIYVLRELFATDKQRPTDLAKAIGRLPTAFTPILDRLEHANLIKRVNTKRDRRSVLIHLTDDAKKIRSMIMNTFYDAEQAGRIARDGDGIPF